MKFTLCDLRHCARQSSGFIVPGRVGWRPARTPDARRGARARSSLPLKQRLLLLIIIAGFFSRGPSTDNSHYFSFSPKMNRLFEALAMLEKLLNLAHLSEAVKNLIF